MSAPPAVRMVFVTAASSAAPELARRIVEGRLAACVNIVPGVRSIYRWQGTIEDEAEALLILKVPEAGSEDLPARIAELHPYDLPEVLMLDVDAGLPEYLSWVSESCAAPAGGQG